MLRFPIFALVLACPLAVVRADEQAEFFETKVRPLLADHCFECHSDKKQQGDLRLDRKVYVFKKGQESVVPGKPDESRLWQVLQYDELDVQMPPKGKLPPEKLQILQQWIQAGAYWPDDAEPLNEDHGGLKLKEDGTLDYAAIAADHWSYRPVPEPQVPEVTGAEDLTAIDRYIVQKLHEEGLTLSQQASRETLIKRIAFDLHGIPPTYEQVEAFVNNDSNNAIAELIDEYLASPLYGQRWGRYWLDVARYADTKGYVFTENRFYPYSYTYRDYVIDAFNNDTPYDQFLMEQMAADQLDLPENDPRLAAMGFITAGPRFLNREPDIIDDRIDVVMRGLQAMTMGCARCHDHKYDPVPIDDYYSLYGVFQSSYEPELPPIVGEIDRESESFKRFSAELDKRQAALDDYVAKTHNELRDQVRAHASDYLLTVGQALKKLPEDITFTHGTPRDRIKRHWQQFAQRQINQKKPLFVLLNTLVDAKPEEFAKLLAEAQQNENAGVQYMSAELAKVELKSPTDVVREFGKVFETTFADWQKLVSEQGAEAKFEEPGRNEILAVLEGPGSVGDVAVSDRSPFFERDHGNKIRELKKKISDWHATSPDAPPRAMLLADKEKPVEPVVFERGNPGRRGARVPRRLPHILEPTDEGKFENGSGRLELASHIASKENPLTARVIVNRVWMYHFGKPLVESPSDFGLRGERPSHPELIDYLAWSLMHQHNWSLKGLHREIMNSQVYLQSSLDRPEARAVDPINKFLWRQNRRRREFESMRDSMLAVAGKLDTKVGGRAYDLEKEPQHPRRSVYGLIDRNNFAQILRTFDFPSPDASSPKRPETTVPQQALFAMNSPFSEQMAQGVADQVAQKAQDSKAQVQEITRLVYARDPNSFESETMLEFLEGHSLQQLAQALMMTNEMLYVD